MHALHLKYPVSKKQPADLNCGLFQVAFELNKRGNTQPYVLECLSPNVQLYTFLCMVIYPPSTVYTVSGWYFPAQTAVLMQHCSSYRKDNVRNVVSVLCQAPVNLTKKRQGWQKTWQTRVKGDRDKACHVWAAGRGASRTERKRRGGKGGMACLTGAWQAVTIDCCFRPGFVHLEANTPSTVGLPEGSEMHVCVCVSCKYHQGIFE